MLTLLLAAVVAVPQSPLSTDRVALDSELDLRVHRQTSPLVALRLSSPVPTGLPEGSVELLQELARADTEALAHRFGVALELRHDPGRAVITVSGPEAAFDAMAAILRRATGEPDLSVASLRRARARAESRVLARLEQPGPRLRGLLHHGVHGGREPLGAEATGLPPEAIRRIRSRLYDPARLRVVLVGDVPDPVIRSAFARWPGVGDPGGPIVVDSPAVAARPQAHREWGGLAFPVEADPAVLAVTAELVRHRVARSALRYGTAEAWPDPAPVLFVLGAAAPGDAEVRTSAGISELPVRDSVDVAPDDMRRYLRRLVAEAAALTGPAAVERARAAVRRRLLLEARTASGKAEIIGRVADAVGAGVSPDAYLDRVDSVRAAEVRALLTRVLETPAVTAEAR
ncbi:MAG: hypothetical protein R3314_04440 [Longimicrobiales bacterium]|nr:hypothetical protein [Longimicrobiales bacterium]